MKNIFELIEPIEGYTHLQYHDDINEEKIRCDLGIMVLDSDSNLVFIGQYPNAVIEKSIIKDFIIEENENEIQ